MISLYQEHHKRKNLIKELYHESFENVCVLLTS